MGVGRASIWLSGGTGDPEIHLCAIRGSQPHETLSPDAGVEGTSIDLDCNGA